MRTPFTRFQGDAGQGEVHEAARGRRLRRAVGELLVCPDCLDLWVAAGFTGGLLGTPRVTRAVASTLVVHALADALQTVQERAG